MKNNSWQLGRKRENAENTNTTKDIDMNWQLIWQVVFVALMFGFAAMSVLVIINGARDVRKLLSKLDDARTNADCIGSEEMPHP